MKKISFLLLILSLISNSSFALDELKDVGISKYAVLEITSQGAPLREQNNENARRISHLFKNTVLFADKQNEKYYRVELKDNKYAWINKNLVEVQAIIPEKRLEDIEKITFRENSKKYLIDINTNSNSPFQFVENKNNLNFTLFDTNFDPTKIKNQITNNFITYPNTIETGFSVDYNNNKPLFGYDIDKTEYGYLINIKKAPKINPKKPLKHLKITLDAGHGGNETGVCANNLQEKDINLQITKKLKKEFKKRGAKVYLTRKKDNKVDLYDRPLFAKEKDSDILLSIHQNSLPNWKDIDKKYGVGTYYYHEQSKPLAQKILNSLVEATQFRNDNVNYASFVLTRPTTQLSVLIECGYLIRKEEAEKLSDKKFQKIISKAIVKGCEEYLKENF